MMSKLGYHSGMRGRNLAVVAAFVVLSLFILPASAQINGVPASVTSIGFGGHFNAPGVPASVTSIGPLGLVPRTPFFTQQFCCLNSASRGGQHQQFRHHQHQQFFGGGPVAYAVPYAVPYPVPVEAEPEEPADEAYNGGPTIFDRRGTGQPAPYEFRPNVNSPTPPEAAPAPAPAEAEAPVSDQPQTVLVYRDGHQEEVSNYAIVGDLLYDLTPGHRRKIALADLDLHATSQQNDSRGIDFVLPPGVQTD